MKHEMSFLNDRGQRGLRPVMCAAFIGLLTAAVSSVSFAADANKPASYAVRLPITVAPDAEEVVSSNGGSSQGTGTITVIDPAELTSIHTFLTANSLTATQTSTGLNYVITTLGTGAIHKAGDSLTVKYVGKILNADGTLGTQFDANSTGFQFTLGGNVIAGWNEAFALLPVGTVAKLLIPAALAYGASSPSSSIPANSILEFDVTLVS